VLYFLGCEAKMNEARRVHLEHLAFLVAMAGFVIWYFWTCVSAAFTFENLILIGPVAVAALLLASYIFASEIFGYSRRRTSPINGEAPSTAVAAVNVKRGSDRVSVAMMVLFFLFVAAIPYGGFDVASFWYIAVVLFVLGERRVYFVLPLALFTSLGISLIALALLTYPVPTLAAGWLWGML
jgi:hypothetical protein